MATACLYLVPYDHVTGRTMTDKGRRMAKINQGSRKINVSCRTYARLLLS